MLLFTAFAFSCANSPSLAEFMDVRRLCLPPSKGSEGGKCHVCCDKRRSPLAAWRTFLRWLACSAEIDFFSRTCHRRETGEAGWIHHTSQRSVMKIPPSQKTLPPAGVTAVWADMPTACIIPLPWSDSVTRQVKPDCKHSVRLLLPASDPFGKRRFLVMR